MQQRYTVLGVKKFNGEVEGTRYDTTKLFVAFPCSKKSGNELGFDTLALVCGTSSEFERFKGLKFPCELDLDIEVTTKGPEIVTVEVPKAKQ